MTLVGLYYAAVSILAGIAALAGIGPDRPWRWPAAVAAGVVWAGFASLWMPIADDFSPARWFTSCRVWRCSW
ncbi:MAG: hypothetical protein AAF907_02785 [Planctomycetota bacterium]